MNIQAPICLSSPLSFRRGGQGGEVHLVTSPQGGEVHLVTPAFFSFLIESTPITKVFRLISINS
jgi:hypothetical protein